MWPDTFEQRLADWSSLKNQCRLLELEQACHLINDWWFRVPTVNHYLHRDDVVNWPNPWELLHDNLFCDLARAAGIVYTLMDTDHPEITDIKIICSEEDNLVQINQGLYILNWAPNTLLNINSINNKIKKTIDSGMLCSKYN